MELKDYVFILGNYSCNKKCPYCIAKMSNKNTLDFTDEITNLKENIKKLKQENKTFSYFILSGNGEPSLYTKNQLEEIKNIVEESNIFKDYRIQTSGNLFFSKEKLALFKNWLKEITVVSNIPVTDQSFYNYKENYLASKEFENSSRIRVNIVLLKNNIKTLNEIINDYVIKNNVETIALKILDNKYNSSSESNWITENALTHRDIDEIIKIIKEENNLVNFSKKRFIFETKNNKLITLNYDPNNTYDYINLENKFSWHNKKISKGIYGEFSKILEEVEEASDALDQNNHLMYLIELSDIVGAIEEIANRHNLTLTDLINFSNKVKESKKYE